MKKPEFRIRFVAFTIVIFFAGFFVHALFFPFAFTDDLTIVSSAKTSRQSSSVAQNKSLTQVLYIDGKFSPRVVQIPQSYYISIVNLSDKELMWLTSDNDLLATPRGYGRSEELHTILYKPGVYTVSSTLHPTEKLQVIVK